MKALVPAVAVALAACRTMQPAPDTAAIIVAPTEASRAELRQTVAAALGRTDVLLADDTLTTDSLLVVERRVRRDANGLPIAGREVGRPEKFQLVKSGADCVLVHERTGTRYPLAATTCSAR